MEVVAAFTGAVDPYSRGLPGRTDLGEMAQMTAVESIVALVGQSLPQPLSETSRCAVLEQWDGPTKQPLS
jgi:hypothetical protein